MRGYLLPLDCPRCGGDLAHLTGSVLAGSETSAVARCGPCKVEFLVLVQLRQIEQPHTAYQRERRARIQRERQVVA